MIFLFFLSMLTCFITTHAVDIVIIKNQSDTIATVNFVQLEGSERNEALLATVEPNSVFKKMISVPIVPYQFNSIQQVTEYLEIRTKRGIFYCVEGTLVEKAAETSRGFFGLWLEKKTIFPKDTPHPKILMYTQGLSRFGTPTPQPTSERPPHLSRSTSGPVGAAGAADAAEDKCLIALIIDIKGAILAQHIDAC